VDHAGLPRKLGGGGKKGGSGDRKKKMRERGGEGGALIFRWGSCTYYLERKRRGKEDFVAQTEEKRERKRCDFFHPP